MLPLLLVLGLVGCRPEYPATSFAVDHAEVACSLMEDCAVLESRGYESAGVCLGTLEAAADCGDAYDGDAALTCVEEVAAMTCDDLYADAVPAACETACPGLWGGQTGSDTGDETAADTGG